MRCDAHRTCSFRRGELPLQQSRTRQRHKSIGERQNHATLSYAKTQVVPNISSRRLPAAGVRSCRDAFPDDEFLCLTCSNRDHEDLVRAERVGVADGARARLQELLSQSPGNCQRLDNAWPEALVSGTRCRHRGRSVWRRRRLTCHFRSGGAYAACPYIVVSKSPKAEPRARCSADRCGTCQGPWHRKTGWSAAAPTLPVVVRVCARLIVRLRLRVNRHVHDGNVNQAGGGSRTLRSVLMSPVLPDR
jgi:hypothetical protein